MSSDQKIILENFGLNPEIFSITEFGSGHINATFLVKSEQENEKYILQKINASVFKNAWAIANNISSAYRYLQTKSPDYLFIYQLSTINNRDIFEIEKESWRLSHFVENSYSINTLNNPKLAFEAAKAFAHLTRNLHGIKTADLLPSIEGFHDLNLRFKQFEIAIKNGNKTRISDSEELIAYFLSKKELVNQYSSIINDTSYPERMIHHDTKINNVLFDKHSHNSLCVCDLDTLMPGRIISDVGDMVRTYTCELSEESTEFDKINVRLDYYEALIDGYLSELNDFLTESEKKSLIFAGPFIVYMQGLRFLTDYLNNDTYYPIKYEKQNLDRTINQKTLLQELIDKNTQISKIIDDLILKYSSQ